MAISVQPKRRRSEIFQTMNSVKSNNLRLKCQRVTPSGCKDVGIENLSSWLKLNSLGALYIVYTLQYRTAVSGISFDIFKFLIFS